MTWKLKSFFGVEEELCKQESVEWVEGAGMEFLSCFIPRPCSWDLYGLFVFTTPEVLLQATWSKPTAAWF